MQTLLSRHVFRLDGGIGRVICATHAIKRHSELSGIKPVVITAYPEVFYGNSHVHKVYGLEHPWLFDDVIRNNIFSHPEPYHWHKYYNAPHQHLSAAFDEIINGTTEGVCFPELFLTKAEDNWGKQFVENVRKESGKSNVAAYQPFGAGLSDAMLEDLTYRSMDFDRARILAGCISDTMLINCTTTNMDHPNIWHRAFTLRELFAVVKHCDFVIGVDSSVCHIGAAFGKTGVILLGGTFSENIAWPGFLSIYRDGYPRTYFANRFHGFRNENIGALDFNNEDMGYISDLINNKKFPQSLDDVASASDLLLTE